MVHASLFSGIGGFDLAAEWMGWENAFHCEINGWCSQVLKYHFPNSKHYADITKTDFTEWRGKVDIITGGFPCQPFSLAGQRKGAADDRYLWPEMLRVIREVRPTWVIGENVGGIVTMVQPSEEIEVEYQSSLFETDNKETIQDQEFVIETICRDLESEGYSVQPILIPACSVGAPHRRDRIWFIANSKSNGSGGASLETSREIKGQNGVKVKQPEFRSKVWATSHSNSDDAWRYRYGQTGQTPGANQAKQKERERFRPDIERVGQKEITTYLQCKGIGQVYKKIQSEQPNGNCVDCVSNEWNVANSESQQSEWLRFKQSKDCKQEQGKSGRINSEGCNRMQSDNWQNFPTQSPVCSGDDGLSSRLDAVSLLNGRKPRGNYNPFSHWRKESVKAYGNAIVPQVAYEIFKAIEEINNLSA